MLIKTLMEMIRPMKIMKIGSGKIVSSFSQSDTIRASTPGIEQVKPCMIEKCHLENRNELRSTAISGILLKSDLQGMDRKPFLSKKLLHKQKFVDWTTKQDILSQEKTS